MDRANIIDYVFNGGNNNISRGNNNKVIMYTNHNQWNYLIEASATKISKQVGDVITTTGGTGSIFIAGVLTEIEDAGTVNTYTNNNDETVQVTDAVDIDSERDEGSNCDMEDSDFLVDYEDIINFHEE